MIRTRLAEEQVIANKFGTGSWAFFRGALSELSRKGMWNRVVLVFCSFALQNMSGAAAINYYSPTLFGSLGISDVSLYTGIYGLVKGNWNTFPKDALSLTPPLFTELHPLARTLPTGRL